MRKRVARKIIKNIAAGRVYCYKYRSRHAAYIAQYSFWVQVNKPAWEQKAREMWELLFKPTESA